MILIFRTMVGPIEVGLKMYNTIFYLCYYENIQIQYYKNMLLIIMAYFDIVYSSLTLS